MDGGRGRRASQPRQRRGRAHAGRPAQLHPPQQHPGDRPCRGRVPGWNAGRRAPRGGAPAVRDRAGRRRPRRRRRTGRVPHGAGGGDLDPAAAHPVPDRRAARAPAVLLVDRARRAHHAARRVPRGAGNGGADHRRRGGRQERARARAHLARQPPDRRRCRHVLAHRPGHHQWYLPTRPAGLSRGPGPGHRQHPRDVRRLRHQAEQVPAADRAPAAHDRRRARDRRPAERLPRQPAGARPAGPGGDDPGRARPQHGHPGRDRGAQPHAQAQGL